MKLKKLVRDLVDNKHLSNDFNSLDYETLDEIKDLLLETDEFKDVDELIIVDKPMVTNKDGSPILIPTTKISDNTKFKKKVYLYSISLTPTIYDTSQTEDKRILDEQGMLVSPKMYNSKDFTPYHKLSMYINHSLEGQIDLEDLRKELYGKIDTLVDNIEKYRMEGDRGVMIRGLYEYVEIDGNVSENEYVKDIDIEPRHTMIFYMEKETDESDPTGKTVSIKLCHKFLPLDLEDKWAKEYGKLGPSEITGDLIDKFISENT